jgi:hypothetical protein
MANYDPSLEDFCDILRDYSLSGLSYLGKINGRAKEDIAKTFGGIIEDNKEELAHKFSRAKASKKISFNLIPMPKPHCSDFLISFFVPQFQFPKNGKFRCSFYLITWMDHKGGRTLAFRFEPGESIDSPHSYAHMQLTRTIKHLSFSTNFELWAPVSYPAFPSQLNTPLQFFAATMVAVHGYSPRQDAKFVSDVIKTAMQTANAADRGRRVVEEIQRVFGSG